MTSDERIAVQRAAVDRLGGIEWDAKRAAKGIMHVPGGGRVEFDFSGFPRLKLEPKEIKKRLPPLAEIVPSLALWDEDASSWAGLLVEARDAIVGILSAGSSEPSTEAVTGGARQHVVDRDMLRGLLDACARGHPNESFFLLRRDARGVISEAIVAPGSKGGRVAAIFVPERLPFDRSIVASFHSHPTGNGHWSEQDLRVFIRYPVNIIAHHPYGPNDYVIYDNRGVEIDVVLAR